VRLKLLREALAKTLPAWQIESPDGAGSSLWVRLPAGLVADDVVARARDADIVVEPGGGFFGGTPPGEYLRIGISAVPTHLIAEGVVALADAVSTA